MLLSWSCCMHTAYSEMRELCEVKAPSFLTGFSCTHSVRNFLHLGQMWEHIHRCWPIFHDNNGVIGLTQVITQIKFQAKS